MNATPKLELDLSSLSNPKLVFTCTCGQTEKYELLKLSAGTKLSCICGKTAELSDSNLVELGKKLNEFKRFMKG